MPGNNAIGFLAAIVSVICFGTNFIPVKKYDTGDGMFFQWVMCVGVWMSGLVVQLVLQAKFEPIAMLGGILWCTGNVTAVPIIQCIGLGLGLLIWGGTALVVGWACAYFGFLGERSEASQVHIPFLNILGALFAVASLVVFSQVKTGSPDADADGDAHAANESGGDSSLTHASAGYSEHLLAPGTGHIQELPTAITDPVKSAGGSWVDKLSPFARRAVGLSLAVLAGVFYGTNFNPPQWLIEHPYSACPDGVTDMADPCVHSQLQYDYIFSHFCGILLASTVYFLAYCAYTRNKPFVSSELALPSFLSGTVWSLAQIGWFIANSELAQVVSFPIVTTGPGVVGAIVGIVLYKEIQGQRNFLFLGLAILVTLVGCICIALSKLL